MNHSPNDRQSPLGPFPGQPAPRLYGCAVEVLRTQTWRVLVVPTGRGFMQVSLDNGKPDELQR
jgi:hypothetical protein